MFRFENLEVWKIAVDYAKQIYKITDKFPKDEIFGLSSQLKRAVVSISANIAEGSGSNNNKEFRLFLNYSIRSNVEVISELFIAKERRFITEEEFNILYKQGEVLVKRITAFRNSL